MCGKEINIDLASFVAPNDQYRTFNVAKTRLVKAMKPVNRHGSIKCNPSYRSTFWSLAAMSISIQETHL